MSRRPATVLQSDVARVIRAAKQAGATEVEVRVSGETTCTVRFASSTGEKTALEPAEEIVL